MHVLISRSPTHLLPIHQAGVVRDRATRMSRAVSLNYVPYTFAYNGIGTFFCGSLEVRTTLAIWKNSHHDPRSVWAGQ